MNEDDAPDPAEKGPPAVASGRRGPRGSRRQGSETRGALDFALARLARRAHAEAELVAKMERARYGAREIAAALDLLKARRYLDDRSFGISFARSAAERKRWGPARVRLALRARGLKDSDIQEALRAAFPDGGDDELARALSRFRRADRREGPAGARRARAYRHLVARGFSPEAVRRILRRERSSEENETP